ncbi:MAG: NAD-binding protein [Desulfovibrionaceae bacterium]|nr:NAD-binding protein [Desulfovibrionaceae bacterium]
MLKSFMLAMIGLTVQSTPIGKQSRQFLRQFFLFTVLLIALYSFIFHELMLLEGRDFSAIDSVYWTMTVMSTLGFGDITFHGTYGRFFSIIVMLSGVLLFMLVMPLVFVRFVYRPWMDAYNNQKKPRQLPESTENHVIIVGEDDIALGIADRLSEYKIPYALLVPDGQHALELYERHYHVVVGEFDSPATYAAMRANKAALVVALCNNFRNTNIVATVHENTPHTKISAGADTNDAVNILKLAGCDYVFHFPYLLGHHLARRVHQASSQSSIVARFGQLCIAETSRVYAPYANLKVRETGFRKDFGLNIVGIWENNRYAAVSPDSLLNDSTMLLLAGTEEQIQVYDQKARFARPDEAEGFALILGGGRVGMVVAHELMRRNMPFRLVERRSEAIPQNDSRFVCGDASDIALLQKAGLENASSILITTQNDDLNIYLTIYCRKIRPKAQILCRSTLDRNVASLYAAGANAVMSHTSMVSTSVLNLLRPETVAFVTEGLSLFKIPVPKNLEGIELAHSKIREKSGCNVIALKRNDQILIGIGPHSILSRGSEIILIGSRNAERRFMQSFYEK